MEGEREKGREGWRNRWGWDKTEDKAMYKKKERKP